MEDYAKVFSSNITRAENSRKNNLYDLINIVPAKPLKLNDIKKYTCNFSPKTDKYYIPKRKSRLKVKTVRDIRKSFEQDTFTHLFNDLETQQNNLFKKIRRGSSRDDNTTILAKTILKGDNPISRSTWQMLVNLNPEQHTHTRQYVLWNGKYIQVNGSVGGTNKLICNYDLAHKKIQPQNLKKSILKQSVLDNKKGLLRNSLSVRFKPGPLSRKQYLDESHQKYHLGKVELINLPKPGLDIQPTYGTALESTITHFLNNLRTEDGTISHKWAELAVSVLGTIEKSNAVQFNRDCVTFDLNYKNNQNRILMRRDANNFITSSKFIETDTTNVNTQTGELAVLPEIEEMMIKILDSVEIHMIQDKIYAQEEELRQFSLKDVNSVDIETNVKDKTKRKFCELDRLDVTVITLPETEERCLTKSCNKMHCTLGCICASLKGTYNLKQHCGRVECMFNCNCDFPKYKNDLFYADCSELPAVLNLDEEINLKLAKEEKKFRQTVIVSGQKRILLKAEKRNWEPSKKYLDFYSNMRLKNENQKNQSLSIIALKLNFDNIEPWCMVHKLYKCFCKGKFSETCASVLNETVVTEPLSKETNNNPECLDNTLKRPNDNTSLKECIEPCTQPEWNNLTKRSKIFENNSDKKSKASRRLDITSSNNISESIISEIKTQSNHISFKDTAKISKNSSISEIIHKTDDKGMIIRRSSRISDSIHMQKQSNRNKNLKNKIQSDSESSDYLDFYSDENDKTSCSRTNAYEGRKYTNGYYKNTNNKILEMEKNDTRLQERLANLNNDTCKDKTLINSTLKTTNDTTNLLELLCDLDDIFPTSSDDNMSTMSKRKRLSSETKLVAWLESNYKKYKEKTDSGLVKKTLEPPRFGKIALHSWDFILKRYRERKNLFLITHQKPFRIFMAVNTRNPFFEKCMNINDIRFADLNKYPQTVKNLLINATDLKDNFCILRGLTCCWELIGSVTKVNDIIENSEINVESSDMDSFDLFNQNDTVDETKKQNTNRHFNISQHKIGNTTSLEDAGSSKWFVMTVENDFYEIRFFRKGFFVKYETIVNAINVARLSGKTVRLSSKKCIDECDFPQFGIYAIPNDNEYCVFVGPYEMEDTLGIETIKTIIDVRKLKRTRGFWITTNKVDNFKVVEDPLSFVSSNNTQSNNAIPLESHFSANNDMNKSQQESPVSPDSKNKDVEKVCSPSKKDIKMVKPIKIRKTNGFYHLASDGILKKISLQYPQNITKAMQVPLNSSSTMDAGAKNTISNIVNKNSTPESVVQPTPEMLPQIQISTVYSTQNEDSVIKSVTSKTLQEPIAEMLPRIMISSVCSKQNEDSVINSLNPEIHESIGVVPTGLQISAVCPTQNEDPIVKTGSPEYIQEPIAVISAVHSNQCEEVNSIIPETYRESIFGAASQIRITAVNSTLNDASLTKGEKPERGMFILKPEEINRKLIQKQLICDAKTMYRSHNDDEAIELDVESFKTRTTEWSATNNDDIYVISDDENDTTSECSEKDKNWRDVWIECTSTNLGWIAGRKNLDSLLSFKFLGSEYSEFYVEEEAIAKINL